MEYVENGSLKAYLDKARETGNLIGHPRLLNICIDVAKVGQGHLDNIKPVKHPSLLNICIDMSQGMDYLASINMVHSDLAARNILLTDTYKAKITDFGLSKTLMANKDYYRRQRKCKIPAFYVAPEYFAEQKLSVKGDVWGYGVMMWECFSMGDIPNLFGTETELGKIAYHTLEQGSRLSKPDGCPDSVYDLMGKCWKWEPELRPTFTQIHARCFHDSDHHHKHRHDTREDRHHAAMYAQGSGAVNGPVQHSPIHTDAVVSLSKVQPGICLSGSKDKNVVLYDYQSKKIEDRWTGHEREITKVKYGAICQGIFSASRDKSVKLWRRGNADTIREYLGHELVVSALDLNQGDFYLKVYTCL
ncbi:hypothetical protein FSP39_016084 [Pinctada imbricata]|uniref:Protein kinase domain-containing protein n=1 Tax=Pinctada imbricata TaxID=66713 RepID=A0AA88XMP9_PINIB|nr:hypothetical protein FSP39_016084 [Pinctada imbricata]